MIVTNIKELRTKCKPCKTVEEGELIAAALLKELNKDKNGIIEIKRIYQFDL